MDFFSNYQKFEGGALNHLGENAIKKERNTHFFNRKTHLLTSKTHSYDEKSFTRLFGNKHIMRISTYD